MTATFGGTANPLADGVPPGPGSDRNPLADGVPPGPGSDRSPERKRGVGGQEAW